MSLKTTLVFTFIAFTINLILSILFFEEEKNSKYFFANIC